MTWRVVTRQSNYKGRWEWTSTSQYKTKTEARRAAERLRKDLQKDKARSRARGRKFYYRVHVKPPKEKRGKGRKK